MERYCIVVDELEDGIRPNFEQYIRMYPFTILNCTMNYNSHGFVKDKKIAKKKLPVFQECEEEIQKLLNIKDHTDSEMDMHYSILDQSFCLEIVKLDTYLYIYYSMLYKQNLECYIPLEEKEWTPDKKDNIREKRKECVKYIKNNQGKVIPFKIRERVLKEKEYFGKTEIQIQDFAPNISRLYYLSCEFRQIFTEVKRSNAEKYSYKKIKSLFNSNDIIIDRKEEIWLCEYLVGINLARMFYSFFNPILKGIPFTDVEKEYKEIIHKIICKVMKFKGIYTRCFIVHKLKIVYELMLRSDLYNSRITCKDRLNSLCDSILSIVMSAYEKNFKWFIKSMLDYEEKVENKNSFMKKIGEDCDRLIAKHLVCSDGYYLLQDLTENIDDNDESMYRLIQKIILSNSLSVQKVKESQDGEN